MGSRRPHVTPEGFHELEVLFQTAPVGLCFVDRELRFRRVNARMAEINGRPVASHLGATVAEVIPAIADQVVPVYRRILRTGQPVVDLEVWGRLPSDLHNEHTWIVNHHPVKDGSGAVAGIVTVVLDITRQKRAEQELRETQERLAEAQRIAHVGSWEWDLLEDRVWWSAELLRIFGYDHHPEPTFDAFFEHVHPDDRARISAQLEATFARDEPYAVEFRAIRTDGAERWIRARAKLERADDGRPVRLSGAAQDVTPRSGASAPGEEPQEA